LNYLILKTTLLLVIGTLSGCSTLVSSPTVQQSEANAEIQKTRSIPFLSQVLAARKNYYMMAHGGIFLEAKGFVTQEEHAVVLDPRDLGVLVARIAPELWRDITQ
jgi:hypothetical protein